MATLISQISSIKLKVNGLLSENLKLREELELREKQHIEMKREKEELIKSLNEREEGMAALKTANAMLGSDDYKTKTKLKINALVKEIDQCIAQLT